MSESLYKVVLTGHIHKLADKKTVVRAFQEKFSISAEKALILLNGKPSTIKKNLDKITAQRFCQAIDQLGVEVNVEPMDDIANTAVVNNHTAAKKQPAAKPQPGYAFCIDGSPDYSYVTVQLPVNETLNVEASAMATMNTHVEMKTKLRGGLGRLVSGESLFINEFFAQGAPGEIGIAPGAPGDIDHVFLNNETIYLQNSAFVASSAGIEVQAKWQGFVKGFFSGESLFLIRCQGKGDLWFSSYGGIIDIDVDGDYVVDTGNIVAFTEGLQYTMTKVGGYKSLFFSGEGFVCRFSGKGKVWIQTRKVAAFASWLSAFRPVKNKG